MDNLWDRYDAWDKALRDLVYTDDTAHEPAYLDVEDDLLVQAAANAGLGALTAEQAEAALTDAVRATLCLGPSWSGSSVLTRHRDRLSRWRAARRYGLQPLAAPPAVVGLLAVFARAAEHMGRDGQHSAAAYYPRLNQLLSIGPSDANRMQAAFRAESEKFWDAVNVWLDDQDGTRGLPTAESVGPRYVGIPMSQALIRQADRQHLLTFFRDAGLEPGVRLSPHDMTEYLTSWVAAGGATTALRGLWRSKAGRPLLVEAAVQGLAQWDGTLLDATGARQGRPPVLTARLARRRLSRARLEVSFALAGTLTGPRALPTTWLVASAPQQPPPIVDLEPLTDRYAAPPRLAGIDTSSLVTGVLQLTPATAGTPTAGAPVERRPQPIVVLASLDEAGLWVEVERVRLGQPHLLLVNTAATRPNGQPRFDLDPLLHQVAQPGWAHHDDLPGLPDGWTLYRDVVVMARHSHTDMALDPLRPAQRLGAHRHRRTSPARPRPTLERPCTGDRAGSRARRRPCHRHPVHRRGRHPVLHAHLDRRRR